MLRVGILGVGIVGSAVIKTLLDNQEIITSRAGKKIVPVKGVTKDININCPIALSDNVDFVLDDPEIDVVVEVMGGVDFAYSCVKKALQNGKAVVTANKAMLAYHRFELQSLAGDIPFEFEASVGGGIPVINALRDGLSANHILSVRGIINGTCNYILTKMMNEKIDFDVVLKEAQKLGYAEANPSFDVDGWDTAHKLLILASIAYGIDTKPEDILVEGIRDISQDDIYFAKSNGYSIKLLGIAKKRDNKVELRVHPVMIPNSQMIAKVDGVMNGISIIGDKVGETMYYGAGAGGDATSSAVVANLVDIARYSKGTAMMGYNKPLESGLELAKKDDIESKYYIRIETEDRVGVLATISNIMAKNSISIETFLQQSESKEANLLFATHIAKEQNIQKALKEIEALECTTCKPVMIRIEA
jgi:homoserine dehydrogenase